MKVGILAVQGDVREHERALSDLGVATRRVTRQGDLGGLDGVVIPGGESTAMSMLLDSAGLSEPLAKELDAGMPAFGTCAGMILLARDVVDSAPGQRSFAKVDVTLRRNGYGPQTRSFETDLEVPVLGPPPLHAVFIRAPVVESAGSGVEVLATLEASTRGAALDGPADSTSTQNVPSPVLCRQGKVLVCAFHPELTNDLRLHELFVSTIEAEPAGDEPAGDEQDKSTTRER